MQKSTSLNAVGRPASKPPIFSNAVATDDHAGGGHAGIVLLQRGAREITGLAALDGAERVIGDAADAEQHAGVLDLVGGIIQHRPRRTDAVEARARDERIEPVLADHFHVVVEEAQQAAARLTGAEIVHP